MSIKYVRLDLILKCKCFQIDHALLNLGPIQYHLGQYGIFLDQKCNVAKLIQISFPYLHYLEVKWTLKRITQDLMPQTFLD